MCLCLILILIPNLFNIFSNDGYEHAVQQSVSNGFSFASKSNGDYVTLDMEDYSYNEGYDVRSENIDLKQDKKLIVTGDLILETKALDDLLDNIYENISKYNGYIQDATIDAQYNRRNYKATIRVPAQNYDEFLSDVKDSGNVTYYHENTKDITDAYTDLNAKLTSLKAQEERVLEFYKQAETISELLTIEERLSDIRYEIDYIETQLKNYDLQVAYSTLYITIRETEEYTETSESYWTRFVNSFKNGWHNFVDGLGELVLNITYNIWTIIILVLIGFGGFKLTKRIIKKKK